MQKISKYLLFVVAVLFIIPLVIVFLYKGNIVNNLKNKEKLVESKWAELLQYSSRRNLLLNELSSHLQHTEVVIDSLKISVKNNLKNQRNYVNGCSLSFVNQEYYVNRWYLEFLKVYKNGSDLRLDDTDTLIQQLEKNEVEINRIVDGYNNRTRDFNTYISTFPNFYFAKRNGFNKKKFFTIKYGVANEDPVAKSKELPHWAKDKDTL